MGKSPMGLCGEHVLPPGRRWVAFGEQPVVLKVPGNAGFDDRALESATRILNEYGGFIRAVIHFQAHNRPEEEDLFQEFFLALICTPVPADVRSMKAYLYRAIVHHLVDSTRAQQNYRRIIQEYVKENRIHVNTRSPTDAFIDDEEQKEAMIACCARHMQEREAQAFVLRYRDRCSNEEIAVRMGINRRSVSRYLSAGLKKLRKMLAR